MITKDILETVKTIAEILALGCAAAFFLWKLRRGYHTINAALTIHVDRAYADVDHDYLAIAATMAKRSSGALAIHDARALITHDGTMEERELVGYERLSDRTDSADPSRTRITFGGRNASAPFLRLTPDEEATFSTYISVPKTAVCIIQVAVSGKLSGARQVAQWRSSVVSLPRHEPVATTERITEQRLS
jgi:hypothetical protein